MAAIYDKALKRKDFSGHVDENKDRSTNSESSRADVGKIVNLMSTDANHVSGTTPIIIHLSQTSTSRLRIWRQECILSMVVRSVRFSLART